MSDKIKQALLALDTENDAHWTSDHLPRLDVMKELAGQEVSRADIQAISKTFNRKNATLEEAQKEPEQPKVPETPETDEPETPEDIVDTDLVSNAVEAEYEKATQGLVAAQKRFKAAQAAMDELITEREREASKTTFADSVKMYQESQRKQREARAGSAKALAELAKKAKV